MTKYALSESLEKIYQKTLTNLRVALPARIERFDFSQQKAEVTPLLEKRQNDGTVVKLPVIVNVPVIFPRGGDFSLTFPLERGDTVLLLFSDRSLDRWLQSDGRFSLPQDPRKHDLTDAIVLPGLVSFGSGGGKSGFPENNDDVTLKHKDTKIVLESGGSVKIEGDLSVNGNLSVEGNINANGVSASGDVTAGLISLQNHTHVSGSAGAPTGPPLP